MNAAILRWAFPRARPEGFVRMSWLPILVAAAYYVGCLAGFSLRFPGSGISFFWPPTAVLTAALILTSSRWWSLVLAASFAAHAIAHAQDGVPVAYWPVQFLGNTVQAVLAATGLSAYLEHPHLDLRRDQIVILEKSGKMTPADWRRPAPPRSVPSPASKT